MVIDQIHKTKSLSRIGVTVLSALALWIVAACLIPTFRAPESCAQLYTIRHQDLRDNNSLYTDFLLKSIKDNDGYLVLGTSETNELPTGNYFDFLNADTSLHATFSVIGGAGRTACTYFPLLQSNENVQNLKVIYFVNPAYWCNKLASSNADYFHRYVSITEYKKSNNPKNQDIDRILKANLRNVRWLDRVAEPMARVSDRIRRKYYQDLVFTLDFTQFYETLIWPDIRNITRKAQQHNPPDSNRYNYSLNVSRKFDVNSYELRPHPEEQYRYDELRTMVRLCKERGVDIVFVVGPYNHVAFEKVHPEELAKMQQVPKNIISLLEEEHANYINCSDLSTVPGAFEDWQHPNSYGAYLIYQKIRDYVLEKENR